MNRKTSFFSAVGHNNPFTHTQREERLRGAVRGCGRENGQSQIQESRKRGFLYLFFCSLQCRQRSETVRMTVMKANSFRISFYSTFAF
jgi:hypothetical protein